MNKEEAIRFAGFMEDYLHIPSFVCEMIQFHLENNNYKEVVEYVIQRRNEIENKDDYISEQQAINMWTNKIKEKDEEIERLNKECDTYMKIATKRQQQIDKAIEYLTNDDNIIDLFTKHDFRKYPDFNVFEGENPNENVCCAELYGYYELLNILQGEDNDED